MKSRENKQKVILSLEEVKDVLHKYHLDSLDGGHSGINNTIVKISRHYTWKGLADDVKEFISCCAKCQNFAKIKTQAPILKPITVSSPWELVGMDLIGPFKKTVAGNVYTLTFTDYFTKFVVVFPLQSKAAAGVVSSIRSFIRR
jgi:hypothetical protein